MATKSTAVPSTIRHMITKRARLMVLSIASVTAAAMLSTSSEAAPSTVARLVQFPLHLVSSHSELSSDWLSEINYYREGSGLAPVTDNSSWDAGILNHLTYLENSPSGYFVGAYQSLHTENPESPYYTTSGAYEGLRSDLLEDAPDQSPVQDIDGWLGAPFHALAILNPALQQVAFASQDGDAGLDVSSGAFSFTAPSSAVFFPGSGTTTNISQYSGDESPDPLETCGWTNQSVGLPLIAMLPSAPPSNVSASITSATGEKYSSSDGNLCIVDASDYISSDPVYGPTGLSYLQRYNAVILIPNAALNSGEFTASLSLDGAESLSWSFTVNAPLQITGLGGVNVHSVTLYKDASNNIPFEFFGGAGRPYTWTVVSGVLPHGVQLSPSGYLTGSPTATSCLNCIVTITATDSKGNVSSPFNIGINEVEVPTIATHSVRQAKLGHPFSMQLIASSWGEGVIIWALSSGSLPPGLSLSSKGLITGTPKRIGQYSFDVKITDGLGKTGNPVELTLKVAR